MKKIFFGTMFSLIFFSCGTKKTTPEIFLIPSDYRGEIRVVFNQPCGEKEVLEDKKRVYIIPESGILITQSKQEFGIVNQEFYYVDAKGKRTVIKEMEMNQFNQDDSTKKFDNEPSRDQLGAFFVFTGSKGDNTDKKVEYSGCYIGSFTEVRYKWMDNAPYSNYIDSVQDAELKLCNTATK